MEDTTNKMPKLCILQGANGKKVLYFEYDEIKNYIDTSWIKGVSSEGYSIVDGTIIFDISIVPQKGKDILIAESIPEEEAIKIVNLILENILIEQMGFRILTP